MGISPEQLRQRYSTVPTDELRRIISAPPGHYTPEDREVASTILFTRRFERPDPPPPPPTLDEARNAARWAALGVLALIAAHSSNHVFHAFKAAGVEGDRLVRAMQSIERSPWTYVFLAAALALVIWRRRRSMGA
jgi:hypothetical protein